MKNIWNIIAIALIALGMLSCGGQKNPPEPVEPTEPEVPEDDATQVSIERLQVQPLGMFVAYMLYDDDTNKVYVFPVYLTDGATDVESGKTYVYPGDMHKTYAYWMLSDYSTHALYKEASFTKTDKGSGGMLIKARVLDENNDKWALTFNQKE